MSREDFLNRVKTEGINGTYTTHNYNFYAQSLEDRIAKACWHAILDMDCSLSEKDRKAEILQQVNKFICGLKNEKREEGEIEK